MPAVSTPFQPVWPQRICTALMLVLTWVASASWANPGSPQQSTYTPQLGQPGKDVIWIPTPVGLIDRMLEVAKVSSRDRLYDLGAGDGIIPITAARRFGTPGVGIEYNPQMADFARSKVAQAGVTDKVRIITGDIFKEDFSAATVVTLYLYPELNMRLRPTLLAMKPGTRVVSHAFTMGDWEPDATVEFEAARAFLWVVPARVEGEWVLRGEGLGGARLKLEQTFQQIGGTLNLNGIDYPLVGARLEGQELRFKIITAAREVQAFRSTVVNGRMEGQFAASHLNSTFQGARQ